MMGASGGGGEHRYQHEEPWKRRAAHLDRLRPRSQMNPKMAAMSAMMKNAIAHENMAFPASAMSGREVCTVYASLRPKC